MSTPLVSVIIPVGPRHSEHARLAAGSVAWQSLAPICETILALDGGADVPPLPNVRILPSDGVTRGPAHTRNRALAAARGVFTLPLDADDYLLPHTVEHLLREYSRGTHGYIYGDSYTRERDGRYLIRSAPDYNQAQMRHYNLHVVTALTPTKHWRAVGGWDERVDAWEDWTGHLRLAMAGICGYRLPYPIFVYRVHEGDRMVRFYGGDRALMEAVLVHYRDREEFTHMASCCGGDADLAKLAGLAVLGTQSAAPLHVEGGRVRVEYLGPERGTITWDYAPGHSIRLGNNASHRYADLTKAEADWLAQRAPIRIVPIFDAPDPPLALAPLAATPDGPKPVAALRPAPARP